MCFHLVKGLRYRLSLLLQDGHLLSHACQVLVLGYAVVHLRTQTSSASWLVTVRGLLYHPVVSDPTTASSVMAHTDPSSSMAICC